MYIKALFILVTALYSLIISANDSKKINRYDEEGLAPTQLAQDSDYFVHLFH